MLKILYIVIIFSFVSCGHKNSGHSSSKNGGHTEVNEQHQCNASLQKQLKADFSKIIVALSEKRELSDFEFGLIVGNIGYSWPDEFLNKMMLENKFQNLLNVKNSNNALDDFLEALCNDKIL